MLLSVARVHSTRAAPPRRCLLRASRGAGVAADRLVETYGRRRRAPRARRDRGRPGVLGGPRAARREAPGGRARHPRRGRRRRPGVGCRGHPGGARRLVGVPRRRGRGLSLVTLGTPRPPIHCRSRSWPRGHDPDPGVGGSKPPPRPTLERPAQQQGPVAATRTKRGCPDRGRAATIGTPVGAEGSRGGPRGIGRPARAHVRVSAGW